MGKDKMIRDPIYGYIEIPEEFSGLVDSAEFQRLRNIIQTGYQALYPSALHNRFVHSLGVYHLGCAAIDFFWKNVSADIPREELPGDLTANWERIRRTFLAACLLHDVGHSPFSHTGEAFYEKGANFVKELAEAAGAIFDDCGTPSESSPSCAKQLYTDMKTRGKGTGNPHEAMSALVGLSLCRHIEIDIDPDLFIRSIIGAQYDPDGNSLMVIILNAVIGMLNGQLIDVDKLDYIGRDSYVTGYSSLTLDTNRLLSSYTVGRLPDNRWGTIYKKSALSVIENVIYANDLERRWIQNHPAILYDCELVDSLLRHFDATMRSDVKPPNVKPITIFTRQAISAEGMSGLNQHLRLLCDDDIVSYIKNEDDTEISRQYFARKQRLKPLWKTEAEFEYLANKNLTSDIQSLLANDLKGMREYIRKNGQLFIDKDLIDALEKDIREADKRKGDLDPKDPNTETVKIECEKLVESYRRMQGICCIFQNFTKEYNLKTFSYVFVLAGKFQTGYRKLAIDNIHIQLGTGIVPLKEVMSLRAKEISQESPQELFYVYTAPENLDDGIDLGSCFMDFLRRHYSRP